MADRDRYYDQPREERGDPSRRRSRGYDARLDDRTGVEPGTPGGYRGRGADYRDEGRSYDARSEEARSFEPRGAYRSEFAKDHQPHRPEHEISEEDYRRRRGYYRSADFSGREEAPRPDYRSGSERMSPDEAAYKGYTQYPGNPYDQWWGIGSGFGFGHDMRGTQYDDRDYGRDDSRRGGRGFWNKASDEVASWMGDEAAHSRREIDRGEHAGRGPKGYKRSDDRIREELSDRLTNDSWLDASEIEVSVKDGEVTLNGKVASRDDKRRAETWADGLAGVEHVQNNLRVDRDWHSRGRASGHRKADEADQSILDKQARGKA